MSSARIGARLLRWYDRHGRKDLPWKSGDPYHVWLSEVMLQQTQVATVIPYFERFIKRFPTIKRLARADTDAVLHLWAGLGYYARARNLHRAAQVMATEHGGVMPQDFDSVAALPGIGRSTAGAILALSYGSRHPILDGNVKRVLARYHAIDAPLKGSATEKKLWELADYHTPRARVADYTQAIMDLGATLCRRGEPDCPRCPLRADCAARAAGNPQDYPRVIMRKQIPTRSVQMLLIRDARGRVLLQRRPPSGIWGGLWSLPECSEQDVRTWSRTMLGLDIAPEQSWAVLRHTFSHFHLDIHPVPARLLSAAGRMGEPELSRTHLMHIRAGDAAQDAPISRSTRMCESDRPTKDGRAGASKRQHAAPGAAGMVMEDSNLVWYNCQRPDARGVAAPVKRLLDQLRTNSGGGVQKLKRRASTADT